MQPLAAWDSFYVIVGSAAGALIGLQFVALTLLATGPAMYSPETGAAYATPTTVHFTLAFGLSALSRAPWPTLCPVAALWALVGFSGAIYALIVTRQIRHLKTYEPQWQDWLFHATLPFVAHLALKVAAFASPWDMLLASFVAGGATLLLVLVGVHNAWDVVTHHVFVNLREAGAPPRQAE